MWGRPGGSPSPRNRPCGYLSSSPAATHLSNIVYSDYNLNTENNLCDGPEITHDELVLEIYVVCVIRLYMQLKVDHPERGGVDILTGRSGRIVIWLLLASSMAVIGSRIDLVFPHKHDHTTLLGSIFSHPGEHLTPWLILLLITAVTLTTPRHAKGRSFLLIGVLLTAVQSAGSLIHVIAHLGANRASDHPPSFIWLYSAGLVGLPLLTVIFVLSLLRREPQQSGVH